MHHLRPFALVILLTVLSVAPAAARQATPAATPAASPMASPAASPVAGGASWTVATRRSLTLDGTAWSLSPDGRWIAGTGARQGTFCVWATADGTGSCQGEKLAVRPETITWAPDSSAVAFSLNAIQYLVDSDIYVYEVKERKLHDLTDDGIAKGSLLGADKLAKPIDIDDVPAWSPDGTQLAFVRTSWGKDGHPTALMRIARDGGSPTRIRTIDKDAGFAIYEPVRWLPEDGLAGDRLLFTIALPDVKDHRNGIWQVGLDGKGLKQLLAGDKDAQIPAPWIADISPDGTTASVYSPLIRNQYPGQQPAFFLVDLQTFEATPIQTGRDTTIGTPPRFSPDGASLLYLGYRQGEEMLLLRQIATGQVTTLVPGTGRASDTVGAGALRVAMSGGLPWAANDTVMLGGKDGAQLLTLAPAA